MILSVMIKSLSHALNLSFKSFSTLTASKVLPHAPAICTSMCMATVRLATPGELKSFSCLFGDPVGMIRITPPPSSVPPCIPNTQPDDTTSCISNNTDKILRKYRSLTDSGICLTPSDSQSLSSSVDTLAGFEPLYSSSLDLSRASSASPTSDLDRLSPNNLSDISPLRISTPNKFFLDTYKKDEFKKDLENKRDKPMLPVKVSGPPHFYKFQNILPGKLLHRAQFPSFWQDGVFLSWPMYDTLTDSTPCISDTSRSQSEERDCVTSVDSNTLEWDAQSLQRRMRELPSCLCNSPTKLDITGLETVLEDDDIPPQDVMKAVNDWELGYPHGEILTEVSELESSDDCFTLDSYSLPDTDMESIAGSELTPSYLVSEQLEPDDNSIGKVEKIDSKTDNITLSNTISGSVEDCKTASTLEIKKENVEVGHEHESELKVCDKTMKENLQPVCQEPELNESDIDISVLFSDTFDKAYKRSVHKENKEKKRSGKKKKVPTATLR